MYLSSVIRQKNTAIKFCLYNKSDHFALHYMTSTIWETICNLCVKMNICLHQLRIFMTQDEQKQLGSRILWFTVVALKSKVKMIG